MSHEILVINAGSSSIKISLFDSGGKEGPVLKLNGKIDGIGTPHPQANAKNARQESILEQQWERNSGPQDHGAAMTFLVGRLTACRTSTSGVRCGRSRRFSPPAA